MSESAAFYLRDYKTGPMWGKKDIDISSDDYVSEHAEYSLFTVTIKTGTGTIHYEDALGEEHTETWAAGKTIMAAAPDADHPIPLFIRKVFSDSQITEISVAW